MNIFREIKLVGIKLIFSFLLSCLLTSCATILNNPYRYITVYTNEPSTIIHKKDTLVTKNNQVSLVSERKKEDLLLIVKSDSLTKNIGVKSRNSLMFWANLPFNYGIGMLVDMNNPERYSYPRRVYITSTDTLNKYSTYKTERKKGEIYLNLSLPHINSFLLSPDKIGRKTNTGFLGVSAGLDWVYSKKQFLNFSASAVMDFIAPFPASLNFEDEHEWMNSIYFAMSNNHKIGRFSLGYGLSYGINSWKIAFNHDDRGEFDPIPISKMDIAKKYNVLGLVFPIYFQTGNYFNIGVIYRPTFYRPFCGNKFVYEHLISIDFAWKIKLN